MLQDSVFSDPALGNLSQQHTFTRMPNVAPMARALHAAGATMVDRATFRMRNEERSLETPLVGTPYEVLPLKEGRITTVHSRK